MIQDFTDLWKDDFTGKIVVVICAVLAVILGYLAWMVVVFIADLSFEPDHPADALVVNAYYVAPHDSFFMANKVPISQHYEERFVMVLKVKNQTDEIDVDARTHHASRFGDAMRVRCRYGWFTHKLDITRYFSP